MSHDDIYNNNHIIHIVILINIVCNSLKSMTEMVVNKSHIPVVWTFLHSAFA